MNHFIEIGYDSKDRIWVIIHSGSRGIGHGTATHYMRIASGDGKAREGHYPLDVLSPEGKDFIMDLNFTTAFALQNRLEILVGINEAIRSFVSGNMIMNKLINRNHNHAELRDGLWIHRKGATHADKGMMGVIPGNMRDGSFIVEGKGNPDSLYSSSHGAGRKFSRKIAKTKLNVDDFRKEMEGIISQVGKETLDESPGAYKDIFKVMELQKELVEVIEVIKPIINVKAISTKKYRKRK